MTLLGILISALGGAGIMYLLDPQQGNRRRALLRDQMEKYSHQMAEASKTAREQAQDRVQGAAAGAKSRIEDEEVSDEILVARVRSEMGHLITNASAVEVMARNGYVTLSGALPEDEVKRLVAFVKQIRGVKDVDNHMNLEPSSTSSVGQTNAM